MTSPPGDRDKFYDDDEDDGAEYELLPPDAEVIAGEQARAAQAVEEARHRVRVEDLYHEPDQINPAEYLKDLAEFRLRFTTKQLLIVMTLVAISISFGLYRGGFATILVLTFLILASAYGYVSWQEHKRREAWYREREELLDRNRPEAKS